MERKEGILKQQNYIDCAIRGVRIAADHEYFPHKVLISLRGCKPVREMGPESGSFRRLDDLFFREMTKTQPILFYYGLPELCPVCGKEASKYVFYKSAYFSRSVSSVSSAGVALEELAEFRSDIRSERWFLLVPFCDEHENAEIFVNSFDEKDCSENEFYVRDPFFTGLLEQQGFALKKVLFVRGYGIPEDIGSNSESAGRTVRRLLALSLFLRLLLIALTSAVLLFVPSVWRALPSLLVMALFVSFNLIQWLTISTAFDRLIRRKIARGQYDEEDL
jgi:hypothetical protein